METRARSPPRDTSAMCADETGRCAKPGFDRHLSSYQRAPVGGLQRRPRLATSPPPPGRRVSGSRINARITSASYHIHVWLGSFLSVSYGRSVLTVAHR